jgi:hypothetical protein
MNKATNTKETNKIKRTKRRLPTKITHITTQVQTSTSRNRVEHTHIQKPILSMPKRDNTPKQNKNDRKRTTLKYEKRNEHKYEKQEQQKSGERTKRRHLGLNHFAIRPERRLQAAIIRGPCQASDKTSVLLKLGHD